MDAFFAATSKGNTPNKAFEAIFLNRTAYSAVRRLSLPINPDHTQYFDLNLVFLQNFGHQIKELSLWLTEKMAQATRKSIIDHIKPESLTRLVLAGNHPVFYKQLFCCPLKMLTELECPMTERFAELSSNSGALKKLRITADFREMFGYVRRTSDLGRKACGRLVQLIEANPNLELLSICLPRESFSLFLQHLLPKLDGCLMTGTGLLDRIEDLLLPAPCLKINGRDLFTTSILSFKENDFPASVFEDIFKRTFESDHSPEECMEILLSICDEIKTQLDENQISAEGKLSDAKIEAISTIFNHIRNKLKDPNSLDMLLRAPFMLGALCAHIEASNEDDDELSTFWWNMLNENILRLPDALAACLFDGYQGKFPRNFHKFCLAHSELCKKISYFSILTQQHKWIDNLPTGLSSMLLCHPDFDVDEIFQGVVGTNQLFTLIRRVLEDSFHLSEETLTALLDVLRKRSDIKMASPGFVGISAYAEEPHWLMKHTEDPRVSEARRLVFKAFPLAAMQIRAFHIVDWYYATQNSFDFLLFVRATSIARCPDSLRIELGTAMWIAVLQIVEKMKEPDEAVQLVLQAWRIAEPTASFEKLMQASDDFFQFEFDGYTARAVRAVQGIIRDVRIAGSQPDPLPDPLPEPPAISDAII
jgi:hypothetical protein